MSIVENLEFIKAAAIRSQQPCQIGSGIINGRTVTAMVVRGFRNEGGKRKPSIQWKVDGSVVSAADLIRTITALN